MSGQHQSSAIEQVQEAPLLKRLLQNTLLFLFSLLFIALLSESLFYILNKLVPATQPKEPTIETTSEGGPAFERLDFFQYHTIFGYSGIPNVQKEFLGRIITHNSKGLRGNEVDYRKPRDTFRMAFFGDSQMWGWGVSDNETIPAYAETIASAHIGDKKFDSVNFGASGYGLDQSYLRLISEGLQYKPDVIVLSFFADNDIWETGQHQAWGLEKPFFERRNGGLCVTNVPTKRAVGWPSDNIGYIMKKNLKVSSTKFSLAGMHFDLANTNTAGYFKHRNFTGSILSLFGNSGPDPLGAIEEYVGCMDRKHGRELSTWEQKRDLAIEMVIQFRDVAKANDIPFMVATKPLEDDFRHLKFNGDYVYILSKLGAANIDVIEVFTEAKNESIAADELFIQAGHLSRTGNRLIATEVLQRLGIIDANAFTNYQQAEARVTGL